MAAGVEGKASSRQNAYQSWGYGVGDQAHASQSKVRGTCVESRSSVALYVQG